jgi:sulfopropanediol 3-dehydrogenase
LEKIRNKREEMRYLKKAAKHSATGEGDVREAVELMLREIEEGGEEKAREYGRKFDGLTGEVLVSDEERAGAKSRVDERLREDIRFAADNVRKFAEAQLASMGSCELEIVEGLVAGQKHIPVGSAGCYVPGGRYSHVASAVMTVMTAKVAGVSDITATTPPLKDGSVPASILYALDVCGVDRVLKLGGVQGIASLAFGLFGARPADILVGPGNQFVAEAKRILYGRVGIDMFAGPTESLVIADGGSDPHIVAWDLVGQAEHGYNSPVWLVTLDEKLGEEVKVLVEEYIETLPKLNGDNARAAWADYGEVVYVESREEAVEVSDRYAPEHLQVQASDEDWWLEHLGNYGSLFLGEETTVAYGDKVSGPNHVLPTKGVARYSGGLYVGKYMKTVTWQKMTREANRSIGSACARISRLEGMEAHARTADVRLEKYFPGEKFALGVGE